MKNHRYLFFVGLLVILLSVGYLSQPQSVGTGASVGAVERDVRKHGPETGADSGISISKASEFKAAEPEAVMAQTPRKLEGTEFAPSLLHTEIDGRLAADAQGNLIIEASVKDFFDYFLTAVGEVSMEQAIAQIHQLAHSSLPEPAAKQALEMLNRYLAYEREKQAYLQQPLSIPAQPTAADYANHLQATFDDLKLMRRQHLGDVTATVFFAMEEAYGDYTVDAIRIQTDPELELAEKKQRLHALVSDLPEPLQAVKLQQIDDELQAQAGLDAINSARTEAELRQQLSAASFTPEKTEDLVRFWHEDRQFQSRYVQYESELARVESSGLAVADRDDAIERLRLAHFVSQHDLTRAKMRDLER